MVVTLAVSRSTDEAQPHDSLRRTNLAIQEPGIRVWFAEAEGGRVQVRVQTRRGVSLPLVLLRLLLKGKDDNTKQTRL